MFKQVETATINIKGTNYCCTAELAADGSIVLERSVLEQLGLDPDLTDLRALIGAPHLVGYKELTALAGYLPGNGLLYLVGTAYRKGSTTGEEFIDLCRFEAGCDRLMTTSQPIGERVARLARMLWYNPELRQVKPILEFDEERWDEGYTTNVGLSHSAGTTTVWNPDGEGRVVETNDVSLYGPGHVDKKPGTKERLQKSGAIQCRVLVD